MDMYGTEKLGVLGKIRSWKAVSPNWGSFITVFLHCSRKSLCAVLLKYFAHQKMHFTRVLAQLMRIVLNYRDYACIDCMQSFLKCETSSAMSDFSWWRLFVNKWSPLHLCSRWKNDCSIFMSGYWPILEKLHHLCSNKLFYLLHLIHMAT